MKLVFAFKKHRVPGAFIGVPPTNLIRNGIMKKIPGYLAFLSGIAVLLVLISFFHQLIAKQPWGIYSIIYSAIVVLIIIIIAFLPSLIFSLLFKKSDNSNNKNIIALPHLQPIPIRTKGKGRLEGLIAWIASVRQWLIVAKWEYTVKTTSNLGAFLKLKTDTKILIPNNFQFDGASIPKPLWAILSPTGIFLVQGLIHDYGYRYDYLLTLDENNVEKITWKEKDEWEEKGQDFWDIVFREVGKDVNGLKTINHLAWFLLYLFGCFAWKKRRKEQMEQQLQDNPS